MENLRAHLARADLELEAALRLLDPKTDDEAEIDLVRAIANARTSVGDALETIGAKLGEPPKHGAVHSIGRGLRPGNSGPNGPGKA